MPLALYLWNQSALLHMIHEWQHEAGRSQQHYELPKYGGSSTPDFPIPKRHYRAHFESASILHIYLPPADGGHKLQNPLISLCVMPSVSFDDTCTVHRICRPSQAELPLLWWSQTDIKLFKIRCDQTVKHFKDTHDSDDCWGTYCMRGLENWSNEKRRTRGQRIRHVLTLVLKEQAHLMQQGVSSPFSIAETYRKHSEDALVHAQLQGALDEAAVMGSQETESYNSWKGQGTNEVVGWKRRRSSTKLKALVSPLKNFARRVSASSTS